MRASLEHSSCVLAFGTTDFLRDGIVALKRGAYTATLTAARALAVALLDGRDFDRHDGLNGCVSRDESAGKFGLANIAIR